jgi:hypothetical protein
MAKRRPVESLVLTEHALALATQSGFATTALRSYNNLAETLADLDRYRESLDVAERGLMHADRIGDRSSEMWLVSSQIQRLVALGRWDDAVARSSQLPSDANIDALDIVPIEVARGRLEQAEAIVGREPEEVMSDVEWLAASRTAKALVLHAPAEALAAARSAVEVHAELGVMNVFKVALAEAISAALDCDDLDAAEELLGIIERLRPGELTPFLRANGARFRALLDGRRGVEEGVDERFREAAADFRDLGTPFWLAMTLLEHAEWLAACDRMDEAALVVDEARGIFEQLGAKPWLERLARLDPGAYASERSAGM